MSDDKKNIGNRDRQNINICEDYELQNWSKKFGVSPQELKRAIDKAGLNEKAVESYFKKGTKNKE